MPPFHDDGTVWNVQYTITDSSPITGISAIDPLTGAVLASHPNVTIVETPEATILGVVGVKAGTSIATFA